MIDLYIFVCLEFILVTCSGVAQGSNVTILFFAIGSVVVLARRMTERLKDIEEVMHKRWYG